METLDQLKARHEAELSAAQDQARIIATLPAAPERVMATNKLGWWVTYKIKTLADVAALVRLFAPHIIPTIEISDGCLYRQPEALLPARLRDKPGHETTFGLTVHQGRGFGPSVKFEFHAAIEGEILRIICDLPDNHRAGAELKAPSFDRQGYPAGDGSSAPNRILRGLFHDQIQWSPNQRGLDARYTYTLTDDGPEYRETLEILGNTEISNWWGA